MFLMGSLNRYHHQESVLSTEFSAGGFKKNLERHDLP